MGDLRAVIADDHYLVRQGVRRALEDSGTVAVVAEAGTPEGLQQAVAEHRPDVVVTDIRMPPTHQTEGIQAAHRIRARWPEVGVVVLSQYAEAAYALELLGSGSDGLAYLLKDRIGDPAQLVHAVREVAAGGSVVDPEIVGLLLARSAQEHTALSELTPRELDVLERMAQGRTNAAIAGQLHLSESSVEKYATSMFAKLGLAGEPQTHRRVAAVLTYLRDSGRARPT